MVHKVSTPRVKKHQAWKRERRDMARALADDLEWFDEQSHQPDGSIITRTTWSMSKENAAILAEWCAARHFTIEDFLGDVHAEAKAKAARIIRQRKTK